jgi:hypothetical protein
MRFSVPRNDDEATTTVVAKNYFINFPSLILSNKEEFHFISKSSIGLFSI